MFTSIDVTVNFGGDNRGTFGGSDLLSPWNHAFQNDYAGLLNFQTVIDRLRPIRPIFCGEELLIVTSQELRPAANTLADQRRAQGYITSVRETGAGAGQIGTTNNQIRDFIRSRLNGGCLIKPSYVILFGNTAHVPTFLVPCSPGRQPERLQHRVRSGLLAERDRHRPVRRRAARPAAGAVASTPPTRSSRNSRPTRRRTPRHRATTS